MGEYSDSLTQHLSFDTYPVRRLYTQHCRFPHLSLVYRSLLCCVDVCWSSVDTHWPFMWLSVLLFQSESCSGLVTQTRCHEINSHEINRHQINSHEINLPRVNSHEINLSRDQLIGQEHHGANTKTF